MLREAKPRKRKSSSRSPRIKGLCRAAEHLGCHRNHLYLVLSGRRVSHSLQARYDALPPELRGLN